MYLIKKELKSFSAAHRLIKNYQGVCASLHGHNYVITIVISGQQLDEMDSLIDFDVVTELCEKWLFHTIGHGVLICSEDTELLDFVRQQKQRHYVLPNGRNTTAEALAEHFFEVFDQIFMQYNLGNDSELLLMEVEVAESPTSKAIYRRNLYES